MTLTTDLLLQFFAEQRLDVVKIPANRSKTYQSVRLYYPGAARSSDCLCLLSDEDYAQIAGRLGGTYCVVTPTADVQANDACFVIRTPRPAAEVFGLLQVRIEALARWDLDLSDLLLREATLQEILARSAPILRAPCFLQDANFHLLAASGQVEPDENHFFYETLRTGAAPSGLFTRLLAKSTSELKAISSTVRELPDQHVMIADCRVNDVAALHFCLYYGQERRQDLPDLIMHLMQRLEAGPSIRRLTSRSSDLHDALFAKILDTPDGSDFAEICSALGLYRYQHFTAVCFAFGGRQTGVAAGQLTRLRALHPRFWFFQYREGLYSVLGSNPETRETDMQARHALLQQLGELGAACGISLDGFSVQSLGTACSQAAVALQLAGEADSAGYQDVLVRHMLNDFYSRYPYGQYCPTNFLQLLEDDRSFGTDNLTLLRTFLSNNCNATAVSRILHMHRNNVLYRIERIKAKYNLDLSTGDSRLMLQLLAEKAAMEVPALS